MNTVGLTIGLLAAAGLFKLMVIAVFVLLYRRRYVRGVTDWEARHAESAAQAAQPGMPKFGTPTPAHIAASLPVTTYKSLKANQAAAAFAKQQTTCQMASHAVAVQATPQQQQQLDGHERCQQHGPHPECNICTADDFIVVCIMDGPTCISSSSSSSTAAPGDAHMADDPTPSAAAVGYHRPMTAGCGTTGSPCCSSCPGCRTSSTKADSNGSANSSSIKAASTIGNSSTSSSTRCLPSTQQPTEGACFTDSSMPPYPTTSSRSTAVGDTGCAAHGGPAAAQADCGKSTAASLAPPPLTAAAAPVAAGATSAAAPGAAEGHHAAEATTAAAAPGAAGGVRVAEPITAAAATGAAEGLHATEASTAAAAPVPLATMHGSPAGSPVAAPLPSIGCHPPSCHSRTGSSLSQGSEGDVCSICFSSYATDDMVTLLPCGHFYHQDCLAPWLQRDCTCPLCKQYVYQRDRLQLPAAEEAATGGEAAPEQPVVRQQQRWAAQPPAAEGHHAGGLQVVGAPGHAAQAAAAAGSVALLLW